MNRMPAVLLGFGLVFAGPAALAQTAEERALAAAFSQADLNTLAECQARVEGGAALYGEFGGWLKEAGHAAALAAAESQKAKAPALADDLRRLRKQTAQASGMKAQEAEAAYQRIKGTFVRRPGEDDYAAYSRWHPETRLPPACFQALERGRWRTLIDQLPEAE